MSLSKNLGTQVVRVIEYFRERLKTVIKVSYIGLGLLAILHYTPLVDKHHAHTWAEKFFPFFWAIFGFVACVLIIIISKWYGHLGIMTREDYYND